MPETEILLLTPTLANHTEFLQFRSAGANLPRHCCNPKLPPSLHSCQKTDPTFTTVSPCVQFRLWGSMQPCGQDALALFFRAAKDRAWLLPLLIYVGVYSCTVVPPASQESQHMMFLSQLTQPHVCFQHDPVCMIGFLMQDRREHLTRQLDPQLPAVLAPASGANL